MNFIHSQIEESLKIKQLILDDEKFQSLIEKAASICSEALRSNNKVFFAGNGGSAADSQHLAGELVNRFGFERPGLAAIALTTDTSIITSISNDYGFDMLFSRQIQALGKKGDIFIALSTSGNSTNIINGLKESKKIGIKTIGLTGRTGGKMGSLCDINLKVPSDQTPRIQEAHILIGHIICSIIENSMFSK
jgi:D-sedoheptulose 7-phosphate isomerase